MTASSKSNGQNRGQILVGSLVIALLAAFVYFPSIKGEFLWDDTLFLTDNPCVTGSDGLKWIWFSNKSLDYLPLVFSSFWFEWRLWGANPLGYHVVNLALHVLGVILLWRALVRLQIPYAWWIAALFAVHPVNVASVAWIFERKNVLSFVFYITSIIFYLRYDSPQVSKKSIPSAGKWYWLSLGAFALALLSKVSVIILPMVLLGCVWWRKNRITLGDLIRVIPFFALSLIRGSAAIWLQSGGVGAEMDSRSVQLLGGSWGVWFYLWKAIVPVHLSMIYPRWEIDVASPTTYLPGLALVAVLFLCWRYRRGWGRPCLFGLGYFVVALLPALGFFSLYYFVYSRVADHWAHLALPGVLALLLNAVAQLVKNQTRWAFRTMATILICWFTFLSHERAKVFASYEALWQDTVAKNPKSPTANYNLGKAILDRGGDPVPYFTAALDLKPDYAGAHNNLGITFYNRGQIDKAILHFREYVRLEPNNFDAHNSLGSGLIAKGELAQGIAEFAEALRLNPNSASAHNNMGGALAGKGDLDKAMGEFAEALRLDPNFSSAHKNLGQALAMKGFTEQAKTHYSEALRVNPNFADAHFNMAAILLDEGKVAEAVEHYSATLRINPDFPGARERLAEAQNRLK